MPAQPAGLSRNCDLGNCKLRVSIPSYDARSSLKYRFAVANFDASVLPTGVGGNRSGERDKFPRGRVENSRANKRSIRSSFTLFWNCNFNRESPAAQRGDGDGRRETAGGVTFRVSVAVSNELQLRESDCGFMVHRGASGAARGAIKPVTTPWSLRFCEPLWRYDERRAPVWANAGRRLILSSSLFAGQLYLRSIVTLHSPLIFYRSSSSSFCSRCAPATSLGVWIIFRSRYATRNIYCFNIGKCLGVVPKLQTISIRPLDLFQVDFFERRNGARKVGHFFDTFLHFIRHLASHFNPLVYHV